MSNAEELKRHSRQLRGTLADGLRAPGGRFTDDEATLLKFHGAYQQEDRDQRVARMKAGLPRAWAFLVRCKIPGGRLTAEQYLALDELAGRCADGTLRLTSRQDVQYHGVPKERLKELIAGIHAAGLTTFGACGDVARNVTAPAAPLATPAHREAQALARELTQALLPRADAYREVWLDAPPAAGEAASSPDLLYGPTYLPRKFKTAILVPPRNDVDVYTHDLSYVAHLAEDQVEGYTVLAGGGMGMTFGQAATYPALAQPFGFVPRDKAVETALAVLRVFRDWGDREDRKHARLKYLVAEKGVAWLRSEVQKLLSFPLGQPRPFTVSTTEDLLGWNAQGDGRFFYGLRIESGRVRDPQASEAATAAPAHDVAASSASASAPRIRALLRALVQRFRAPLRLTSNQNVLFCDLAEADRAPFEALVREHGLALPDEWTRARRMSISCVGLPTCGQALAESERFFPKLMDQVDAILKELGLEQEPLVIRMTGCANGCARPYNADLAFTGRGAGKYAIYAGGSFRGDRLAALLAPVVPAEQLAEHVRALLSEYAAKRLPGEHFSDYWARTRASGK